MSDRPLTLREAETPAIVLDKGKLRANCERLKLRCQALGVRLRPHMKTLKSIDAARMAVDPSHGGIAVSTLNEAEYFAQRGFVDIQCAVCITADKLPRAARILERASRFFARRLERFFPALAPVKAEYVWNGVIAATTDSLPRFLSLSPGLDAAIGCNGRGVALTTALGRDIAGLYSGKLAASEFPLAHERPRGVPGRSLAEHGPSLWLPWSTFRDWQDARR